MLWSCSMPRAKVPPQRPGPKGGKRARNRQQRTDALIEAGLELFLARGVANVSIDDIARAGGMAKGNFYRYFDDKGALVDAILAPLASEVRTAMRKCAVAIGRAENDQQLDGAYAVLAADLAQAALPRLPVVQLYLQENRAPHHPSGAGVKALAAEMSDGAVQLSKVAVDKGLLQVANPQVSALAVVGAVEQLALAQLRGQLDAPPLEVANTVVSMVLRGIGRDRRGE